jgi:hypothetical protein
MDRGNSNATRGGRCIGELGAWAFAEQTFTLLRKKVDVSTALCSITWICRLNATTVTEITGHPAESNYVSSEGANKRRNRQCVI